jgi:hypothetical protein
MDTEGSLPCSQGPSTGPYPVEGEKATQIICRKSVREKHLLVELDIDLRIELRSFLKKWSAKCGLDSSDSEYSPVVGSCGRRNEPSGSSKCGEFLHQLMKWPYLTGNTLRHRYRAQPVNAVWGNSRCLL